MRILVCGDRNWIDEDFMRQWLHDAMVFLPGDVVIEGEARGADSIARNIALSLGLEVERYPAEWDKYARPGRKNPAGPIRNIQMLKEGKPDLVLAFHDNIAKSTGTKHMIEIAKKAGVEGRLVTH